MAGLFIVFEGGDGVGKSTQIERTRVHLTEAYPDLEIVQAREPGGTAMGREVRNVVMHGDYVAPKAEALLYAADRAHNVATVVRPALERGAVVIQDRYIDSSIVYQGGARELGDEVERVNTWGTGGLLPDLTILLDRSDGEVWLQRDLDRVETDMVARREHIREAFRERAALEPSRYAVIDAARSVDEVQADVAAAVDRAVAAAGLA